MAMCATLWSWCKKMSYWNSPIISSKYAYSIEIYTSIYPSGVFSVIATWIGRKKKGWIVKKNLYSCYEEVYLKFLIHYSLSSSSYHKSISKSVWYDLLVDRLQRRRLSGDQERLPMENVHHIQSITPCENRSDTSSTKITTKQLPRESYVKRCHNRHLTENLSSCEVVVQLETLPAGRFRRETFCVSCSFTLYIVDFTWKKSFWRYIRKYITKTIE